ncbi:MAG TPA: hypothetical protein VML55_06185 [Planctomycetaceae bacterium]|nr:hypothetical protein [Planctomycetaceae bacterium]
MTLTATITITNGPDRGREFQVADELVNIGRSAGNEIRLSDPDVPEHQASIVHRNGRYAIYAAGDDSVHVDGSVIPGQRWVWLPEVARVRVSPQTLLTFRVFETPNGRQEPVRGAAPAAAVPAPSPGSADAAERNPPAALAASVRPKPAASPPSGPPTRPRPREASPAAAGRRAERERTKRQVARFITDATGEPLVKLGEDGHLPELALAEGAARTRRPAGRSEGSPLAVYLAIACSVLLSLILLLLPDGASGPSARETARARQNVEEFYERRGSEIRPWQRLLREARLARGRGDRASERQAYRRVLEMLNSEEFVRHGQASVGAAPSLTGDRKSDQRLRELIAVLLEE